MCIIQIILFTVLYCILPDSPMMFQQTRSSRPVAKFKTASGHHPTGGALEADLSPHGSIRSAGTREHRWLMLSSWLGTDHFGGKSQRRDATADRFAPWRWWWISMTLNDLECPIQIKVRFQDGTPDICMLWLLELTMRDWMNMGHNFMWEIVANKLYFLSIWEFAQIFTGFTAEGHWTRAEPLKLVNFINE